jgi:hypothetical protein
MSRAGLIEDAGNPSKYYRRVEHLAGDHDSKIEFATHNVGVGAVIQQSQRDFVRGTSQNYMPWKATDCRSGRTD